MKKTKVLIDGEEVSVGIHDGLNVFILGGRTYTFDRKSHVAFMIFEGLIDVVKKKMIITMSGEKVVIYKLECVDKKTGETFDLGWVDSHQLETGRYIMDRTHGRVFYIPKHKDLVAQSVTIFPSDALMSDPSEVGTELAGFQEIDRVEYYSTEGGSITKDGYSYAVKAVLNTSSGTHCIDLPPPVAEIRDASSLLVWLSLRFNDKTLGYLMLAILGRSICTKWIPIDIAFILIGPTGSMKTVVMELLLSAVGYSNGDGRHITATFNSTSKGIWVLASVMQNSIFLVDDLTLKDAEGKLVPANVRNVRVSLTNDLVRNFMSGASYTKLSQGGAVNSAKPINSPLVMTAEHKIPGLEESVAGRLLVESIAKGDINTEVLSECQHPEVKAQVREIYSTLVQQALKLSEKNVNGLKKMYKDGRDEYRLEGYHEHHSRLPEQLSSLKLGLHFVLKTLKSRGAIGQDDYKTMMDEGISLFKKLANRQPELKKIDGDLTAHSEVVGPDQIIAGLEAILGSGKAHLATNAGKPPKRYQASLGWKNDKPSGVRIGYVDKSEKNQIFVLSGALLEKFSSLEGAAVFGEVSMKQMAKGLKQAGYLEMESLGSARNTVRRKFGGKQGHYYCIRYSWGNRAKAK